MEPDFVGRGRENLGDWVVARRGTFVRIPKPYWLRPTQKSSKVKAGTPQSGRLNDHHDGDTAQLGKFG